jgi:hypothetical protein
MQFEEYQRFMNCFKQHNFKRALIKSTDHGSIQEDNTIFINISIEQRQLNVRQWNIYNKAARRRQHNLKNLLKDT